jgi:hypothetical protein
LQALHRRHFGTAQDDREGHSVDLAIPDRGEL